jgi:hypothetical protein
LSQQPSYATWPRLNVITQYYGLHRRLFLHGFSEIFWNTGLFLSFWYRCRVRCCSLSSVSDEHLVVPFMSVYLAVCRFVRNNGSEGSIVVPIVAQKWDPRVPIVARQWDFGSHQCKNELRSLLVGIVSRKIMGSQCKKDIRRNNHTGSHECNNDLHDVAWRTPLECQCTSKSTPFQSCFPKLERQMLICYVGIGLL